VSVEYVDLRDRDADCMVRCGKPRVRAHVRASPDCYEYWVDGNLAWAWLSSPTVPAAMGGKGRGRGRK
jgi:hypothetical protein